MGNSVNRLQSARGSDDRWREGGGFLFMSACPRATPATLYARSKSDGNAKLENEPRVGDKEWMK